MVRGRAVWDLSAVFAFGIRQELLTQNPCSAVNKPAIQKRTRFLTLDEMRRFGEALGTLEAEGANAKAIAIMRLWAPTGCRRNEMGSTGQRLISIKRPLFWRNEDGPIRAPPRKRGCCHLKAQLRVRGSDYVFASDDDPQTFFQGTKRYWVKAVKLANLPGVTPPTLRHTIGSAAVSTGETLVMTGALLGHTK